ncbi:MAG: nucleotide exchange factor GrpE [Betaproteobacteria bacterium]|nr:nucleotide exchange factor GrpE [Betaproteobacteria bacterium]
MPDASTPSDPTDPAVKSTSPHSAAPHSAAETASLHPSASMAGADSPAASAIPGGTAAGAEMAAGLVDGPDIQLPSDAAALMEAQARVAEYHEAYLRAKAEMENIRRRAQEDIAKTHKYAIENFAEGLVPVVDSLEAALATPAATPEQMRSGVEITLRQLLSAFEKARLTPIDPKGERFDPNRHQAISMVPSADVAAQHVVAVLQKGWVIADRVLKPALVTVSNGAAG